MRRQYSIVCMPNRARPASMWEPVSRNSRCFWTRHILLRLCVGPFIRGCRRSVGQRLSYRPQGGLRRADAYLRSILVILLECGIRSNCFGVGSKCS